MSKVSAVAKMTVKPEKADQFAEQWDSVMAHIGANEPGTEHYVLHRSSTDPNVFFVTEIYADQAAVDAHMGSPAFAEFGGSLGDFVESVDLQFATPVRSAKA
jgi:quinol monooxygenase YgiN